MKPVIDYIIPLEMNDAPVNADIVLSVSAILPPDLAGIESFVRAILGVLRSRYSYYELLLIDNGLTPALNRQVQVLQGLLPNVRLVRLSRHYGHEVALAAALDHCIGDYVVVMDPTIHPPEIIPALVARAIEGCDTVVAEPANQTPSRLQRYVSAPVYRLASRILGFPLLQSIQPAPCELDYQNSQQEPIFDLPEWIGWPPILHRLLSRPTHPARALKCVPRPPSAD